MKLGFRTIAFLIMLSVSQYSNGQTTKLTQDFESWNSISLKKDFGKLDLSVDMQARLNNDASTVYQYFGQLGAEYKVFKPLSIGMAYRWAPESEKEGFVNTQRVQFDLKGRKKFGDFKLEARLRYQIKNEADELDDMRKLRFKSGFRYNIPSWKLDPRFSVEYFRILEGANSEHDKMRYTLGTSYKFNKHNSIGAFYRIEREFKESYPATFYILGLNYSYKF